MSLSGKCLFKVFPEKGTRAPILQVQIFDTSDPTSALLWDQQVRHALVQGLARSCNRRLGQEILLDGK